MNRLKELRKSKGITQAILADHIGISQNAYSYWETGKSKIDDISLRRLSEYFGVSIGYILGVEPQEHKGIWINVLGDVAAGIPIEAVEDIVDQEEISEEMASQGDHFALRVRGNSMEPRIHEGDVVIVRKQSDVEDGDICVVLINGDSATVKKMRKRTDGLVLIPFNPSHDPVFFSISDIASLPVVVLGKVVELRAKF